MDNKALVVTLVVVFVGGLVLGSASFGGLSGRAVTGTARVDVSPDVVSAGSFLNVYIDPRGYDCVFYIYNRNAAGQATRSDIVEYARGQGRSCDQPTTYRYQVPLSYQGGVYEVRVYDEQRATGTYVLDTFSVV